MPRDSKDSHGVETSNGKSSQLNEREVIRGNLAETLTLSAGNTEQGRFPPDGFHDVDWVEGSIQASDGKTYYKSCCINGRVHELLDHVLTHFDNDKLIPSKLQMDFLTFPVNCGLTIASSMFSILLCHLLLKF